MTLYILDSDSLSLYQRGYEPLGQRLLALPSDQIAITVISVEELIRGRLAQIRKATKPQERVYAYYWFAQTLLDRKSAFFLRQYLRKLSIFTY